MPQAKPLAIAAALVVLLTAPAAADYQKIKVAVIDFQLQGKGHETEDMGKIVAEWLITALVREGRFDVIERRMLAKLLEEQKLGQSGILDADTAARIGKMLGVKVVISGSIQKLQDFTEVNARIIQVESASILAAESIKSASTTKLEELVAQMAGKIIQDFPLEGYIVNRDDRGVLLDLGSATGAKPGMWFMAYREGEAIKHPKTGAVIEVLKIPTGYLRVTQVTEKTARAEVIAEGSPSGAAYGHMVKSVPEEAARGAVKEMGKPLKARLTVSAGPPGAAVRLLNAKQPYTPGMTLDAGKYEIEVSLPGYERDRQTVELAAGDDRHLKVNLVPSATAPTPSEQAPPPPAPAPQPPPPVPESARLTVATDPAGARVRLLNTKTKYSPGVSLPAGAYRLEIGAEGYETVSRSITLSAGEHARLELSLPRKTPPETAAVPPPPAKADAKPKPEIRELPLAAATAPPGPPREPAAQPPPSASPPPTAALPKPVEPPSPPAVEKGTPGQARRHPVRVGVFPWNLKGDAVGYQARLVAAIGSRLTAAEDFSLVYCAVESSLAGVRQPRDGGPTLASLEGIWKKRNILASPTLEPETAARLGRELDLDAVLTGSLGLSTRYADQYAIQGAEVHLMDLSSGKVLSTGSYPPLSTVEDALGAMVSNLLKDYRTLMRSH